MTTAKPVCLYLWAGDAARARQAVTQRFPHSEIREIRHSEFRSLSASQRLHALRQLRGHSLVFWLPSLAESKYRLLLQLLHPFHGCRATILADERGEWRELGWSAFFTALPSIAIAAARDAFTLLHWHFKLRGMIRNLTPVEKSKTSQSASIAFLYPNPASMGTSGGGVSHIRGFLGGLKLMGIPCHAYSGAALAQTTYPGTVIPPTRPQGLFWEAGSLAYNSEFANQLSQTLRANPPSLLYQRHCRYAVAGTMISQSLRIPMVLEYNGSEVWIAGHWDPTPFRFWLAACEDITLRAATRICVVSDPLRAELIQRGIPANRIILNPNGVDPDKFSPSMQRTATRAELRIQDSEIVVAFVGTFSLWHGVQVLQQAIDALLRNPAAPPLRFLLIGDGLLREPMCAFLAPHVESGRVLFTGLAPHGKVVALLDAADILVSPHIPMPDGSQFFGSPTKLFEYMAMAKGIVASNLGQIGEVLQHNRNAWLVSPGDVTQLADGILHLAANPALRSQLGQSARQDAIEKHSWQQNAARAVEGLL